MSCTKFGSVRLCVCLFYYALNIVAALRIPNDRFSENKIKQNFGRESQQDIVTWDSSSLLIRGERIFFLSGEFHPWRLPSPDLWLDVFQKIKALGFAGVSFYVMWGLVEGEPGNIRTNGVFALEPFFEAAKQAGIYLLARPGPYINSETSGGGFPGWLQRTKGLLRSTDQDFENPAKSYISHVGNIIADAQITNGGPVVLLQPENEYTLCFTPTSADSILEVNKCLDPQYMSFIEQAYRDAGITVPFIVNDALPFGDFAPGTGVGAADIYGYDSYPLGWGSPPCSEDWSEHLAGLSTVVSSLLANINYTTSPHAIVEFQGGAPDAWGGVGEDVCAAMINHEFERVFYKANYAMHTTFMNLYMTFGGTNWGNLGYPSGYTSYDVGAAIREDRRVDREKYSELKLQANFFRASPAFSTAQLLATSDANYTNNGNLTTTALRDTNTSFYIVRHTDFASTDITPYALTAMTSRGAITIPQLGGKLTLHGRDSKIHVVDYDIGGTTLIYSSAEVLTWKKFGPKTTLLLYGGENETHEFALPLNIGRLDSTDGIQYQQKGDMQVVQWTVRPNRIVLSFGEQLDVYLLWRNEAYNYWILDLPASGDVGMYTSPSRLESDSADSSVIVKAGYLLRTAKIDRSTLHLTGDINCTTDIELIATPTGCCESLLFNSVAIELNIADDSGNLHGLVDFNPPDISVPDIAKSKWHYMDSLPEITPAYDDTLWTACNLTMSNNPRNLTTPTSLYASDYGFHAGSFVYRGAFLANGIEETIFLHTQAGASFGHSVWLNSTFLGSFLGNATTTNYNHSLQMPGKLQAGAPYVITVVIDHMGLDEDFAVLEQGMKAPRGILDFAVSGHDPSTITWKMTGNLGGEQYHDHTRGPLNEGAMFAERQGYHLPDAPVSGLEARSPFEGIDKAGIGFFATTFDLDIPHGYDVPISLQLNADSTPNNATHFRVQIFINGFQFGKYVSYLGPQTKYPLPEGILNHNGENYLALTLWAMDKEGAQLKDINLVYDSIIFSAYLKPRNVKMERYQKRVSSY